MDLDGYEEQFDVWLAKSSMHVKTMLRILRGPDVKPSPEAMRLEQYLTQAESFIDQATRLIEEE